MDSRPTSPTRVCIRACVTDIPGNPQARAVTLGTLFCEDVLNRSFQRALNTSHYDHCHIPADFDSHESITRWFVYDLDVTCELAKEDIGNIPHRVFLASRQGGDNLLVDEIRL